MFYITSKKQRSILELQDIYLRAKERHLKKREWYMKNVYDRVINEIPIQNGEKVVLHKISENNIDKVVYTEYREYGSWGYTRNKLNLRNREERLFYLTDSILELRYELGLLHYNNRNEDKYFHQYIWPLLEKQILNKLQEQFKRKKCEKSFILKVGKVNYIVTCEDPYSLSYKKFKLTEANTEPINLEI